MCIGTFLCNKKLLFQTFYFQNYLLITLACLDGITIVCTVRYQPVYFPLDQSRIVPNPSQNTHSHFLHTCISTFVYIQHNSRSCFFYFLIIQNISSYRKNAKLNTLNPTFHFYPLQWYEAILSNVTILPVILYSNNKQTGKNSPHTSKSNSNPTEQIISIKSLNLNSQFFKAKKNGTI